MLVCGLLEEMNESESTSAGEALGVGNNCANRFIGQPLCSQPPQPIVTRTSANAKQTTYTYQQMNEHKPTTDSNGSIHYHSTLDFRNLLSGFQPKQLYSFISLISDKKVQNYITKTKNVK